MVWTKNTQEVRTTVPPMIPWWETTPFDFVRIPKELFRNPYYAGLSPEARLLYGFLLDRACLSQANGDAWRTESGAPYVIFTLTEIRQRLNCGADKATTLLRKLEEYGLIRKDRPKRDGPYHIIVHPFSESEKAGLPNRENQDSPIPENRTGESGKPGRNNTEKNNTEMNNTDKITLLREDIHKQIEYIYLLQEFPKDQLDAVVEVMVQVLTSPARSITLGGIPTDIQFVKEKLRSITSSQIQYLFEHMEEQTQPIHSHRAYYLARLCDPPGVVDAFYEQEHSTWPSNIM